MLDARAYCQEVFDCVIRQFEKRGFTRLVAGSASEPDSPSAFMSATFFRDGRQVGQFRLYYKCHQRRKKLEDGKQVHTFHPLRYSLHLEIRDQFDKEIAHKRSSFLRGVPGTPAKVLLDGNGRVKMGRPKVRMWGAHASKTLYFHDAKLQAQFVHDV